MDAIEKQIQDLQEKAVKIAGLKEDVFQETAEIGIEGLGIALDTLKKGFDTWFQGMAEAEYYDTELGGKLQSSITDAITKFTQVKHEINFAPNISVDVKPLQNIIADALNKNMQIYNLLEKMVINGGKNDELYKLIVMMVERQNNVFEKIKSTDYTLQLTQINETLNKPKSTDFELEVTKRDQVRGYIEKATIKATNGR